MLSTIVIKSIFLIGITKMVHFIKYDKYETMMKEANIEMKIIEGKSLKKGGYILSAIYVLTTIL